MLGEFAYKYQVMEICRYHRPHWTLHWTGWTRNGRPRTDSDAQAGLSHEWCPCSKMQKVSMQWGCNGVFDGNLDVFGRVYFRHGSYFKDVFLRRIASLNQLSKQKGFQTFYPATTSCPANSGQVSRTISKSSIPQSNDA